MVNPINLNLDTTYEDLMQYKLDETSDELDKREITSLLFNAFAGNAMESVNILFTMQNFVDMMFADTAPREYLIRRAAERGLSPFPATYALRKGTFNIDVPIGSRFSIEDVNYYVKEKEIGAPVGVFVLEAETPGTIGNSYFGTLLPIDYISGLETATISDILIPGEDEEDTEVFRKRYFNSFESTAFGGNRADYKEKVNAIPGVGGTKVFRAWNGGGTVKLVIIDSTFKVPSSTLVNEVQELVDPSSMPGEGVGIAPIDHIVTVIGATPTTINIVFNITYESGWEWSDIELQVQQMVDQYFSELGEEFARSNTYTEDNSGLIIRISQLETRLLQISGVIDVQNTAINGNTSNFSLNNDSIPVRGAISG